MRVAIVGQGICGISSALAIAKRFPKAAITVFGDRPFESTCSYGPAGLFRLDHFENRKWAKASFERFAEIEKEFPGSETGVKLISGHIQSDNKATLEGQEKNMADIVYNFRWLNDREIQLMFPDPSKYCIHYTAYCTEGIRYIPWLKKQCEKQNVEFKTQKIDSLENLAAEKFDVVVNCAGLDAGKLAGGDESLIPIRGVGLIIDAPFHKHFHYRDFNTFTIPMTDSILVGSVRQPNRTDTKVLEEDRKEIWERYIKFHPSIKDAKIIGEWCGIRPDRRYLRLEKMIKKDSNGKEFTLIHNYGHGGNGFTLAWGCALDVAQFIEDS
uniref:FAD dependent oxidoreductase domain-containing protein n=1 Tax=Panagrolaimus sp. PS1159 TaxID=55785 RepID=A0AC35G6E6_9BILA